MIYLDFETRSSVDLKAAGAWVYSSHPDTEVLCMAWAYEGGKVFLWTPGCPMPFFAFTPSALKGHTVEAHNSFFEKSIWRNIMVKRYGFPEIPENQWACSLAKAAAQAIPRDLENAALHMGLTEQKDSEGSKLMLKMCSPINNKGKKAVIDLWDPTDAEEEKPKYFGGPEEFKRLGEYCKQDVRTEMALSQALRPLSEREQRIWLLDQKINQRGLRVDVEACKAALRIAIWYQEVNNGPLETLTNSKVTKATQGARIISFLTRKGWKNKDGSPIESLAADCVEELLGHVKGIGKEVLEIRQRLNKSSVKKYTRILEGVDSKGRLYDLFGYHVASTGRWGGRTFQPHNLPTQRDFKGDREIYFDALKTLNNEDFEFCYPNVMEVLSQTLRPMIIPTEGKEFFNGDYNAIEARVIMWLAGQMDAVQIFAEGHDIYKDLASQIYGMPASTIGKESDERQLGKQGILGAGFQCGAETFKETCKSYGIIISSDLANKVIKAYRNKYRKVVQMWKDLEAAAIRAIRAPGVGVKCGRVGWIMKGKFLYCRLPSGRYLSYFKARLSNHKTPWGEVKLAITYMTLKDHKFVWTHTYGGKITENVVQAIARDLLTYGMEACEEAGYEIVMHVHDELLTEKNIGAGSVVEFENKMSNKPKWARDLPIVVEGKKSLRYLK